MRNESSGGRGQECAKASETALQEVTLRMACPHCGEPLAFSGAMLLLGQPIRCGSCTSTLQPDVQANTQSMAALSRAHRLISDTDRRAR